MRRIPQTRIDEIRDAYLEWEQGRYELGNMTVDELAAKLGISKPTLYKLRRQGWTYRDVRPVGDRARLAQVEADLHALNQKLYDNALRISELERIVERLVGFHPNGGGASG